MNLEDYLIEIFIGHYEKNTNRHENHKHTKSYKNKINDYIEERKIKLIDEFFKLEAKSKGLAKHLGSKLEPIRSSKGKQRVKWKDSHRGSTSKPTTNLERHYSENILSRGKDIKTFHSNINVKLSNFDQRRKSDGIVPNTKEELKYHKGEKSSHNRKRRDLNRDNNINMRDYQSHQITLSGNGNYEKIYIDPTKAK